MGTKACANLSLLLPTSTCPLTYILIDSLWHLEWVLVLVPAQKPQSLLTLPVPLHPHSQDSTKILSWGWEAPLGKVLAARPCLLLTGRSLRTTFVVPSKAKIGMSLLQAPPPQPSPPHWGPGSQLLLAATQEVLYTRS